MKRFVTDYKINGVDYSGEVDALDFDHAQLICDQRGKGEKVAGVLFAKIGAGPNFGNENADAMLKAFSEAGDDEPPDASEFDKEPSP